MAPNGRTPVSPFSHPIQLEDAIFPLGIIFTTFQGELRVENQQVVVRPDAGENEKPRFDIARGNSLHVVS